MFGRKLEPQTPSTMGGRMLERRPAAGSWDAGGPPFIDGGGHMTTTEIGTLTSRRLGPGAADALAAFSERRAAENQAGGWRRTAHRSRDMSVDERLERLGVVGARSLPRSRVFDLPL